MNAVRVLPEPVGAATSVWRPDRIDGQASSCAPVGAGKVRVNHPATAGWNPSRGVGDSGIPVLSTTWRFRDERGPHRAGRKKAPSGAFFDITQALLNGRRGRRRPASHVQGDANRSEEHTS